MNKLNHVAFIMDGNGRWGKKKRKGRNYGHIKGVDTVKKIVKFSISIDNLILKLIITVISTEFWYPRRQIIMDT